MEKYGKIGKKDLKGYNSRVRHKPVQKGIMVLKLRIWLHFIEGKFTEHFFAFNAHFHEENINPVFFDKVWVIKRWQFNFNHLYLTFNNYAIKAG